MITKWHFTTIDAGSAASFTVRPLRTAILLIAGDKTAAHRFYERLVPLADRFNDEHLNELKEEGFIQ